MINSPTFSYTDVVARSGPTYPPLTPLQTQFRSRLVHELQAIPPSSASVELQRADPLCQLANNLILDHFRCLKYHCSRSVFAAEYADKVRCGCVRALLPGVMASCHAGPVSGPPHQLPARVRGLKPPSESGRWSTVVARCHALDHLCCCRPQRESKTSMLVVLLMELAGQFTRRSLSQEAACQPYTEMASWDSVLGAVHCTRE